MPGLASSAVSDAAQGGLFNSADIAQGATGVSPVNAANGVSSTSSSSTGEVADWDLADASPLDGSAYPPFVCFAAGTMILMAFGRRKRIEEIQPGEIVLSAPHGDPEGKIEPKPVVQVYHNGPRRLLELHIEGGGMIRPTHTHPFFVRGKGFTAAEKLEPGDFFRTHEDHWVELKLTRISHHPTVLP